MSSSRITPSLPGGERLVAFLESLGAARIPHGSRRFLDHLVGTAALLERWGASERAVKAGLFHSVYGTEIFRHATVSPEERPKIRDLLGDDAERIVHAFCACERASIFSALRAGAPFELTLRAGGTLALSHGEITDLVTLFWANDIEQQETAPSPEARARAEGLLALTRPFLTPKAVEELTRHYSGQARAASPPSLGTLLGGVDVAAFKARWPNEHYVAKGPVERLTGLAELGLDDLIRMEKNHTRAHFRAVDGTHRTVLVTPGQEKELYDAGFTLYFHRLSSPSIRAWATALDKELGLVVGCTHVSGFASRRGLGIPTHYDLNDNFVCQTKGVKRWRVAPNTHVKNPTAVYLMGQKMRPVHMVEAPNGMPDKMPEPFEVIDFEPGTVAFVPRGMWHDTETMESESIHFNIQSGLATWKDALQYLLTRTNILGIEDLREPITSMFQGEQLRPGVDVEVKRKLLEVIERLSEGDIQISRAPFHAFVAQGRTE